MSGPPIHLEPYAKFYVNDYRMAKLFTVEE